MKTNNIKELIALLNDNQLTELSYSDETLNITLKKDQTVTYTQNPVVATPSPQEAIAVDGIKAPLVGVFYDKPAPDAKSFVSEGQAFKKGDVLCIIEAMKVMNEIKADRNGVIGKICFEDGQAVAFDDILFELK